MFYLYTLISGAILGVFLGGKLANFLDFRINKPLLIIVSFILQIFGRILGLKGYEFAVKFGVIILIVSYILLFAGLWVNRKYIGLWVVGLGVALNTLVIMVNGGKMPVSRAAAIQVNVPSMLDLLDKGMDIKHSIINAVTRLPFLADIIYVPKWLAGYGAEVVGIGDLVVLVGMFVLTFNLCRQKVDK